MISDAGRSSRLLYGFGVYLGACDQTIVLGTAFGHVMTILDSFCKPTLFALCAVMLCLRKKHMLKHQNSIAD